MERVIRFKKVLFVLDQLTTAVLISAISFCSVHFIVELVNGEKALTEYKKSPFVTISTVEETRSTYLDPLTEDELRARLNAPSRQIRQKRPKPPSTFEVAISAVIPLCIVLALYLVKVLSFGNFYVLIQIAENTLPVEEVTDDSSEES